jgi:hypothetical protein
MAQPQYPQRRPEHPPDSEAIHQPSAVLARQDTPTVSKTLHLVCLSLKVIEQCSSVALFYRRFLEAASLQPDEPTANRDVEAQFVIKTFSLQVAHSRNNCG